MKKKVFHISHHIGCLRDQEYVLNKIGFEVNSYKFFDGVFQITEEIANNVWQKNKDEFNSYDYILTSDTAPLSRIFLQNQSEMKSKLVIWICNRFDYRMETENNFYSLFREAEKNPNIRIVPYSHFEKVWCSHKGVDIMDHTHITPLGMNLANHESKVPESQYFTEMYGQTNELPNADVIVPIYHNDNVFFKMSDFLRSKNISVYNGGFRNVSELSKYKAFIHLPDAFSKFLCFELIHNKIPAILPSKKLLYQLSKSHNYFFNISGSGGAEMLQESWIDWCEWYDPIFEKCRFFYDNFDQIADIINSINKEDLDLEFDKCSNYLEESILTKWTNFYQNF
jgi:hypothetical protein